MKPFRIRLLVCCLLLGAANFAAADVRVGLHLSIFPDLVPVPGYPVYYAPHVGANYFFYDGDYWLYDDDGWYTSPWYDGPWEYVHPDFVPLFVLRVPVRYYRAPPPHFWGWHRDAPPRWGRYWGPRWEHSHSGWDHWDRYRAPRPAPLPTYQRGYSGDRYPDRHQQRELRDKNYGYRPQRDHDRDREQRPPDRGPLKNVEPRRSQPDSGWRGGDDRQRNEIHTEVRDNRDLRPGRDRRDEARNAGHSDARSDWRSDKGQDDRRGDRNQSREPMRDATYQRRESMVPAQRAAPEQRERDFRQDQPRAGRQQMDSGRGDERGRGQGGGHGRNDGDGPPRGRDH
ncbi:MAG: hypothetical protein ABW049_04935 [Spongiibacteraceae bacterium]